MTTPKQPDFRKAAKVALANRDMTVSAMARKFGLARNTVSLAINRGLFPRVRQLVARELSIPLPK